MKALAIYCACSRMTVAAKNELDYTALTVGPGSFTGLRLGISALKQLNVLLELLYTESLLSKLTHIRLLILLFQPLPVLTQTKISFMQAFIIPEKLFWKTETMKYRLLLNA